MITLFYTGSAGYNRPNSSASSSLGGYISNSMVPNGVLNSLFPPLSMYEIFSLKKMKNYIGLGLFVSYFGNELEKETENIEFNLNLNEDNESLAEEFKDIFSFKIGFGPIDKNKNGDLYMESITSGAKPFYLSIPFQKIKYGEPLIISEIPSKGIGMWIEREFNPKKLQEKFGFESDWWENHDSIPEFDFIFNLGMTLKK